MRIERDLIWKLAIYTDDDPNFHPKQYQNSILGSKTLTVFNTYKVMENQPTLYKDPNSAVAVMMEVAYHATQTKGLKDEDLIRLNLPIARKLFTTGFPKDEIRFLMSFVKSYIKFDNDNNYRIFEQKINDMIKQDFETDEDILAILDTGLQLKRIEQIAERERQEKERERQEKERERQEKERLSIVSVRLMLHQGLDVSVIDKIAGLHIEQVLAIQEKYKGHNQIDDILEN